MVKNDHFKKPTKGIEWPVVRNDQRSKMTNGQKWTYEPHKILLLLIFTDFISISELFLPIK